MTVIGSIGPIGLDASNPSAHLHLEREMKPQRLVYLEHDVCRDLANELADALDSYCPDLLGLSF